MTKFMADARVQAAVDNWAPRFTAQGVDYNDFVRTTARIERWDEWLDAWTATADMHAELAREAEEQGRRLTAGEAYVRAGLGYHFAKFVWLVDMAKHRAAAEKAVTSLYAAHRLLDLTAERIEAPCDELATPASGKAEPECTEGRRSETAEEPEAGSFAAGTVVGNLRRPANCGSPPLVFLLPGLDSTKEEFFHWENVFLARGMATLSLEGPGQGETGYTTHIRPDYEIAVAAMLDVLTGRSDIDLERVGIVGVSLGGYYAPRAAAFERRLKAVAAIGGAYDFGACWPDLPSLTREAFVHHSGAGDEAEAQERASQLSLAGVAPQVAQPLLIVFGQQDRLIPWQQAERLAAEAPDARLVMLPDGNHVCNNIPYKYRPLVADWISEELSHVG
jgi:dienelactone hydrolase